MIAGIVNNCHSATTVWGTTFNQILNGNGNIGGLVGNGTDIMNSYATGNVISEVTNTGGLVGLLFKNNITNSYATGNVTSSKDSTGGLVGAQGNTTPIIIKNSYATGNVTGANFTGGLVGVQASGVFSGNTTGSISNSYATGVVTGTSGSTGGLVGGSAVSATVTTSYWDSMRGGMIGVGSGSITGATGLTTAQMQATSGTFPSLLNGASPALACFKFPGINKYPQLYTWDTSTSVCTTTLLGGPNRD